MDQTALITTIIAATAAFVGVIIAEIVSHNLSSHRESRIFDREIYQKLYAPILLDLYLYFEMRTNFRRGHDVNPEEERKVYEKIKAHLSDNLMYASPRLIAAHHNSKQVQIGDETGFMPELYEVELLLTFLNELSKILKRNKIFDKSARRQLTQYRVLFRIWLISSSLLLSESKGAMFLRHKWQYKEQMLTEMLYWRLNKFDKRRLSFGHDNSYEKFAEFVINKLLKKDELSSYVREELIELKNYEFSDYENHSYYPHMFPEPNINNDEDPYFIPTNDSPYAEYIIQIDSDDPVAKIVSTARPKLSSLDVIALAQQIYLLASELDLILGREGGISEMCVWELIEAYEWLEVQEDKEEAYNWLRTQDWSDAR